MDSLTRREKEIVAWIAKGHRNQDIAEQLCLSKSTVRNHITHILAKLHLECRSQLVVYAYETGWMNGKEEVNER